MLRNFIHCFNMERHKVIDYNDDAAIAAFTKGLKDWDLVKFLYLNRLGDFDDIID